MPVGNPLHLAHPGALHEIDEEEDGLNAKMRMLVQLWPDGIFSNKEYQSKMDRLVV